MAVSPSAQEASGSAETGRQEEAVSEPLEVRIAPRRYEEMADTIPDWAEIPLGNGEVGNLLGFLERQLEHEVDFRPTGLMREALARLRPQRPHPDMARVTVEEARTDLILGGAFLGLAPDEIRLRLGVFEDPRLEMSTGRGIYPALDPVTCLAGPLNCAVDLTEIGPPSMRERLGEQ